MRKNLLKNEEKFRGKTFSGMMLFCNLLKKMVKKSVLVVSLLCCFFTSTFSQSEVDNTVKIKKIKKSQNPHYFKLVGNPIFFLLFFFQIPFYGFGQTSVQVGSATTNTTGYPLYAYNGYNYSQQLYLGSESSLSASYSNQYITAIRFYWGGAGNLTNTNTWAVYLGNTSKSSFSTTTDWVTSGSLTQVYNGGVSLMGSAGWITIILDFPFQYTGNNIVVAIDENVAGYGSSSTNWQYSDPPGAGLMSLRYSNDVTNPNPNSPPTASASSASVRANIQFDFYNTSSPANIVSIIATAGTTSRSYPNLKYAFDAINSGIHKGEVTMDAGSADNETISITSQMELIASGSGSASYSNVTLRPGAANITVTSSLGANLATLYLNNTQNLTIDGRIGSAGSSIDLTIENTSTAASYGAIYMYGAQNNTIKYCRLKSSTTSSLGYGTVSMIASGSYGCSNNTIENCVITKSGANLPMNALVSRSGSSSYKNSGNALRNCTISDFQRVGVWLGNYSSTTGYNDLWTIDNNTFCQSASINLGSSVNNGTTTYDQFAILVGNVAGGSITPASYEWGSVVISNNTIGGNGAGGNWTATGSNSSNKLIPVYIAANNSGGSTTHCEVYNNTIADFDVECNYFYGIYAYNYSRVNVGSAGGNKISRITLKHPAAAGGGAGGIYNNTNADYSTEIKNNEVSDFFANSGNSYSSFYGINNSSTTTNPKDLVTGNIVKNVDASCSSVAYGMNVQGYVASNHVSAIKYSGVSPLYGIAWNGGAATGLAYRVENNEVILGFDNTGASTAENSMVYGIFASRSDINLFYNSVLIQGTAVTNNSYCLRLSSNTTGYSIKNNLFYNERTGGSGNHYCISTAFNNTTYWSSSNNAYIQGNGAKAAYYLGDWNGTAKSNLSDWMAASLESSSISETATNKPVGSLFPDLTVSGSLTPDADSWLCAGCVVSATTDFAGGSRHDPAPTTIGAYELDCPLLLPVSFLSFNAKQREDKIVLDWITGSEINNQSFTIEKSADGKEFFPIQVIKGAGNSNQILHYTAYDCDPFEGANYFRIKQTDYDGIVTFSETVFVHMITANKFLVTVFPNPFDEILLVDFVSNAEFPIKIQIKNALGGIEHEEILYGDVKNYKVNTSDLDIGCYILCISNEIIFQTKKIQKTR